MKDLVEKYPEQFKKLGGIIYALNRIDVFLVTSLSIFFTDESDPQSEKNFIFNDALFDKNIFAQFENRLMFFKKAVEDIGRMAEENNLKFDKDKWLGIYKEIKKVQKLRNELAHNFLLFSNDGGIIYRKRKKATERLADKLSGGKGTFNKKYIDLDKELETVSRVCKQSEKLTSFATEARCLLEAVKKKEER